MSTQNFPDNPEVIYNTLTADVEFMSYVGQYRFVGGQELPAVSIQSPGGDMPGIDKISGLECVIHDAADLRRVDYYGSSNIESNWRVFLICWEPANGSVMTQAATRCMEIFSGARSMETVAVADGLGALVQTMVVIPSDRPILTS